ncbi:MAG TPA: peptidoglycan-binding domain-containing protein [Bryobacteraceae bacterium]|nr:peptidoglycan-binding domain-containing protein [Bryobacteraceae bacterium]
MRAIVHCFLCVGLLLGWMAATAAPAKKPRVVSKKTTAKTTNKTLAKSSGTAKKSTPAKSTVKAAKSTKRPARRRSSTARHRVRRPAGQARPAPERLAEIQRALKQRGYYEGDTDGKWDDASTAALKQFQGEQNLKQDGKIGSLSLIALGLGPKRGGVQPPSAPPSPPPPSTAPLPADSLPLPVVSDKAPK